MRDETILLQIACVTAAMAMGVSVAGSDGCCSDVPSVPRVVYALPPTPAVIPPTGYVLDPSDAARPAYPVAPSPRVISFGAAAPYARPTYSEGGYAYADSYPYSDSPYGYPAVGYGPPGYPAAAYDPPGPGYYQGLYIRPAGAPPYTAYRYRGAPSAKIIHLHPTE